MWTTNERKFRSRRRTKGSLSALLNGTFRGSNPPLPFVTSLGDDDVRVNPSQLRGNRQFHFTEPTMFLYLQL